MLFVIYALRRLDDSTIVDRGGEPASLQEALMIEHLGHSPSLTAALTRSVINRPICPLLSSQELIITLFGRLFF
jgi:hypothetical protein